MAKEDEKKPTTAEKGKGKAAENGAEKKEVKLDKDGKPVPDDKKTQTGMRARCWG